MLSLAPLIAVGLSALAGSDTTRTRWTMAEYLAVVDAAHPELIVARERARAAEARIGPARRPPDPMVELGIMNRSLPGLGRSSPVAMDQIRFSQVVPIPGRLGAATDAARERAAAESGMAEETRSQVRWRAATTLIELDRLDRTRTQVLALRPSLEALQEVARARYAAGQADHADVIMAQLEAARLGEELVMLETDRGMAVARLNAMALRPPTARIDTVVVPAPPDSLPPLERLLSRADADRPLLTSRRAALNAARFERRRAAVERWPDLEVGVVYGQQPMAGGGTDRMVSLMVGASLPIWSGSRQRQMRQEAEAMERMTAADLTAAQAETGARLAELEAEFAGARQLETLYRGTLVPQGRAAAASALAGYRTGSVSFETALSSQLAVARAELELVGFSARRARIAAEVEYLVAEGALR